MLFEKLKDLRLEYTHIRKLQQQRVVQWQEASKLYQKKRLTRTRNAAIFAFIGNSPAAEPGGKKRCSDVRRVALQIEHQGHVFEYMFDSTPQGGLQGNNCQNPAGTSPPKMPRTSRKSSTKKAFKPCSNKKINLILSMFVRSAVRFHKSPRNT